MVFEICAMSFCILLVYKETIACNPKDRQLNNNSTNVLQWQVNQAVLDNLEPK
jgi:hypothetical protein